MEKTEKNPLFELFIYQRMISDICAFWQKGIYYMKRYAIIGALALMTLLTACGTAYEESKELPVASDAHETVTEPADDIPTDEEMTTAPVTEASAPEEEATEEMPETAAVTEEAPSEAAEEADDTAMKSNGDLIGIPSEGTASGDIISISVGSDYLDYSIKYGNVKYLEEESTSDTLYFQGVSAGKDNIVISENTGDGVIFREYAVIVNDDLTVELYPQTNGISLLDGEYNMGVTY